MEYEDRITIPTAEGVSLELTLAGLGSRALAGALDLLVQFLLIVALTILLSAAIGFDLAAEIILPLFGLVLVGYHVVFETRAGGRTPGKRVNGLRVVRSSGRPVDLGASAVRNILRLVDGVALGYLPTVVTILVTRRNQRPGDLAADTVVVRDRRARDKRPRGQSAAGAREPAARAATWDVSAVGAEDIATVRAFLERRANLDAKARARLAGRLDAALRPQVGGADETDPERFLESLYDARRARG